MLTIFYGLLFGFWGVLWTKALTMPGEIFGWIPALLNKLKGDWEEKWWEKPIHTCAKCVAGMQYIVFMIVIDYFHPVGLMVGMITAYMLTEYEKPT